MKTPTAHEGDFETVYIPGNGPDFVVFIKSLDDKAQLYNINGNFRWVVTGEDGVKRINRPQEALDNL